MVIKQYLSALCSFRRVPCSVAKRGLKEWQGSCGSRSGLALLLVFQDAMQQALIPRVENTLLWVQPLRTAVARLVASIDIPRSGCVKKKLQVERSIC